MRAFQLSIMITALLAHPWNPAAADSSSSPDDRQPGSETIMKLALGKSTVPEILSRLGPTLVFRKSIQSETRYLCYVSDRDDTLVAFTTRRNVLTHFLLLADKYRYDRWNWCTPTPQVVADLALANGITMGMNQGALRRTLGDPRTALEDRWLWRIEIEWPDREAPSDRAAHPIRYVWITACFSNSALTAIELGAAE